MCVALVEDRQARVHGQPTRGGVTQCHTDCDLRRALIAFSILVERKPPQAKRRGAELPGERVAVVQLQQRVERPGPKLHMLVSQASSTSRVLCVPGCLVKSARWPPLV